MVFNIKLEELRGKAKPVVGGHMAKALAIITYANVVSWETLRIAFMIAALNDLEIKLDNIFNAYVQVPVTE